MVARSLKHMLAALMRACPSAKIAPGPTLLLLLNSLLGTPALTSKDSSNKAISDSPLPVPPPTTESLNGSSKGKKGGKSKGGAALDGVQGGAAGVPAPVVADPAMTHQSLWAAVRSDVSQC
jgi:hypothetical protein